MLLMQNAFWDVGDGFDSCILDTPAAQPPGQRPEQTWNCRYMPAACLLPAEVADHRILQDLYQQPCCMVSFDAALVELHL